MNANALRRVGYQFIQLVNIHFRKKPFLLKNVTVEVENERSRRFYPFKRQGFSSYILDFFEDFCLIIKRRQERKPFREFTEILQCFFFTSLPNKSISLMLFQWPCPLVFLGHTPISSLVSAVDRRTQRADYCTFICHEWTTQNSKIPK